MTSLTSSRASSRAGSEACSRRQSLLHLACAGMGLSMGLGLHLPATAAERLRLPTTDSLPASLRDALRGKQPLVVMVSLVGCAFCKVVRENYLHPLHLEGLPVVQIDMRDARSLVDFTGETRTQDAWVRQHGIKIAPTVMFFGPQGREVAARLNGAYLPDFYGAYLDEQLAQARKAVLGART